MKGSKNRGHVLFRLSETNVWRALTLQWDPANRPLVVGSRSVTCWYAVLNSRWRLRPEASLTTFTQHDSPDQMKWLQVCSGVLWMTSFSAPSCLTDTVSFPSLLLVCFINYLNSALVYAHLITLPCYLLIVCFNGAFIYYLKLLVRLTQMKPWIDFNGDGKWSKEFPFSSYELSCEVLEWPTVLIPASIQTVQNLLQRLTWSEGCWCFSGAGERPSSSVVDHSQVIKWCLAEESRNG